MNNPNIEIQEFQGEKTLWLNSSRIQECMDLYKKEKCDILGLSPFKGCKLRDLDFLKTYNDIKGIYIAEGEYVDISKLYHK